MPKDHFRSGFVKLACAIALVAVPSVVQADGFTQSDLVSDVSGLASTLDPNLKNPWGVSFSATSPFWVSDQASGVATLYTGIGGIVPLVVTIPAAATPPSGPTGQVFNGGSGFLLGNGQSAKFIFDTLGGTIAGWNGGTSAVQMAATPGAVFTGLALASSVAHRTYMPRTRPAKSGYSIRVGKMSLVRRLPASLSTRTQWQVSSRLISRRLDQIST
jgi:hypothetical protein